MSPTGDAAVRLGSDVLLASDRLQGARVGIVCNHASVDHAFRHVIDRLVETERVTLAGGVLETGPGQDGRGFRVAASLPNGIGLMR